MSEKTIEFEALPVEDAKQEHPALWFIYRQYFNELSDEQFAIMVSIIVGTCPYCWKYYRDCRCWDDN